NEERREAMDLAATGRFYSGRCKVRVECIPSRSDPDGNPVRKPVISEFWLSTSQNELHHWVPIVAAD
ncbi:MAG TPA: hypothetical protein VFE09_07275, partial [Rubrobacteraceae bacterium]|nr:hypothetical protein [Rubrobacteraceae bacterium]